MDWQRRAACKGYDSVVFFPDRGDRKAIAFARSVCLGGEGRRPCPVISECLTHALEMPEREGIWGGKAPYQREKMRTARNNKRRTRG